MKRLIVFFLFIFTGLVWSQANVFPTWNQQLRNRASGADTMKFDVADTVKVATAGTNVWMVPSVSTDVFRLGRPGLWSSDSGKVDFYIDFKQAAPGNPPSTYYRLYMDATLDTLWIKKSDGTKWALNGAGGGGGGADTLGRWNVDGGAFASERQQFLSGAGITITKTEAESITFAATLGTDIVSGEIVDGTIDSADIATGAIKSAEIFDETIDSMDVKAGAIKSSEIFDGTIAGADIGTGVIDSQHIATGGVKSAEIFDGTIVNADIATNTIDSTKLANNSVSPNEIANRTITQWLYPVTYAPAGMTHTNELVTGESSLYRGVQFKPYLQGPNAYDTVPAVIWQSLDSTGKHWDVLLFYTLDNFDSWGDTAIQLWLATTYPATADSLKDSLRIFVYRNRAISSNTAWLAATDSSARLTSTAANAWRTWGGNWVIGGGTTPTGSWTDGDLLVIRMKYSVNHTVGTAYVKTGKIRLKYNVKS